MNGLDSGVNVCCNLTISFRTDREMMTAVEDVSLDVYPGGTLARVSKSGCGKAVTSKSIMRPLPWALFVARRDLLSRGPQPAL